MIASDLDKDNKQVYVEQALYQMHRYFNVFYDKEKGIVKTIRFVESGLGKTYWCRALGWLIWAVGGTLRYLDVNHPAHRTIKSCLTKLAHGATKYQGPNGGLRTFVNDENAPEEITGTAMCAKIINEGMRKGWLPSEYRRFVQRANEFVYNSIDEQGHTQKAYVRWAIPAERGELMMGSFFSKDRLGYSGFLMSCLCELMFNIS
jgi:rhamnogalacturonyl hydrolase YesR